MRCMRECVCVWVAPAVFSLLRGRFVRAYARALQLVAMHTMHSMVTWQHGSARPLCDGNHARVHMTICTQGDPAGAQCHQGG